MPSTASSRQLRINHAALTPHTPYIASWSEELTEPAAIIEHPGRGIAYADETAYDRDNYGVLWLRAVSRPGQGQPLFAKVHPLRQRRAMRRLLCNVCARPADRTDDGVLWLLKDHRTDWPGWPHAMGVTEPPICLPCVHRSVRLCPAPPPRRGRRRPRPPRTHLRCPRHALPVRGRTPGGDERDFRRLRRPAPAVAAGGQTGAGD